MFSHRICHGIPDDRKLQEGDIVNIDISVYLDGYHGDSSEMFVVGEIDEDAKKLLQVTYDCWIMACQHVKEGRKYNELGTIIEDCVDKQSLSTVRNFCGHGMEECFMQLLTSCTIETIERQGQWPEDTRLQLNQ